MRSFTVNALGPFSLAAGIGFLDGFAPATITTTSPEEVQLAFVADREWVPVGVHLTQRGSAVNGEFWGDADAEHVRRQVQRIFSLDVDGRGFEALGERDRVVARLQSRFPGLRPVCFWSPYEAAAWAVISHRTRMRQAAEVKVRLARELGHEMTVHGQVLYAFPAPERLAELTDFPGLGGRKPEWLRAVARSALAGDLAADMLRDLPQEEALGRLKQIPGIGDFSAELILIRGAGDPDFAPHHERRLARAIAAAYGLRHPPSAAEMAEVTDGWRPYRSWVSFLLRTDAETTGGSGPEEEDGTHE